MERLILSVLRKIKHYLDKHPYLAKTFAKPMFNYVQKLNSNPDVSIIKNSPYWDEAWYISYYRQLQHINMDPAAHYLMSGVSGARNPGPNFYSKEYLLINLDVKAQHMNPLVHYEKWGCKEGRFISLADIKEYESPNGTEDFSQVFRNRTSFDKHIVTVLASFSRTSKVEDYVLYLLKGLREVSDYIVLVCDNPIFLDEVPRMRTVCDACLCYHHGEYDFGSYKRGIAFFEKQRVFTDEDELLLINDSCYGPVHSFIQILEKLHRLNKDFYGLSAGYTPREYIQSFFYLFTPKVWRSEVFREFFKRVKKELSWTYVFFNYEYLLTMILYEAGFSWNTLVPADRFKGNSPNYGLVPTKYGLTLLKEYSYPIVKIKALLGGSLENPDDILEYIKQQNSELYNIIIPHLGNRKSAVKRKEVPAVSTYTLRSHYAERISQLQEKCHTNKLKVVFLVNMASMFPAQGLMEKMLTDDLFDVELYVIPEVRFGDKEMFRLLDETYQDLSGQYSFVKLAVKLENDEITEYHNVVKGADLICYPSPYNVSFSLYNPYYAVQNNILSIYISYGFSHAKYDQYIWQLYNYNNFWKVYIENEFNYEEYRKYGRCDACNAEAVGYAKMDRLATANMEKIVTGRKKVIIAPHHSVDGGTNEMLMLSNFKKYAELFLRLPKDYPEIDFIFRPHPALFTVLGWKSQWGEERCNEYIKEMCSLPNVEYSTEGDYMEVFAQSDGIIQDCGSFLVEYFYVGKPCCYMLKKEADIENKFSDFGQECLKNCYIAYEEEDIRRFLDKVIIGGEDPMKGDRDKFSHNAIMLNYPHVTDIILERLKKEFIGK